MRITNVTRDPQRYERGTVYLIEYTPNLIQRLFGQKKVVKKFLQESEYCYKYHKDINAIVDEYGNTVSLRSKEILAIIRFQKSENLFRPVDETFPEENPL